MARFRLPVFLLIFSFVAVVATSRLAGADLFDIKFRLTNSVTVEALQFDVDYSAAGGEFVGLGDDVDCTTNGAINAVAAYNNDDGDTTLTEGFVNTAGFSGAVRVATCTFDAASAPAKADFAVTVTDWAPAGGTAPKVKVAGVVAQ